MRALIYGNGVSAKGAKKLLSSIGAEVEFVDDNSNESQLDGSELLVLSPGVSRAKPLVECALSRGIEVIGELELGSRYVKGDIIAITGTNGKTTTAMMLDSIMKKAKMPHHLLGNIGKSLAGNVDKISRTDKVILETSSFQLASVKNFRPHIAVLLNLGVDHIDYHGSIEEYERTKANIFANMDESDYAVLNADDSKVMARTADIRAQKYYYSTSQVVQGAYVVDGIVWWNGERLAYVKDLHLLGRHNIENALASIVVAKLVGIESLDIVRALATFSLPPHRIQFIGRFHHKNYYNDSKATNIEATMTALKCMKGTVTLIIGGYDKGISYKPLLESLGRNVRSLVVFGANRYIIRRELEDMDIRYFVEPTLVKAIERASRERVDNVLFSPGTSSYDMFSGYEERGDMFVKLTYDINEE